MRALDGLTFCLIRNPESSGRGQDFDLWFVYELLGAT